MYNVGVLRHQGEVPTRVPIMSLELHRIVKDGKSPQAPDCDGNQSTQDRRRTQLEPLSAGNFSQTCCIANEVKLGERNGENVLQARRWYP